MISELDQTASALRDYCLVVVKSFRDNLLSTGLPEDIVDDIVGDYVRKFFELDPYHVSERSDYYDDSEDD